MLSIITYTSLQDNPAAVYLGGLAEGSLTSQNQALNEIACVLLGVNKDDYEKGHKFWAECPWSSVRYVHVNFVRARLSGHLSAATVNRHLCALRGVLKAAWRMGQMSHEDYAIAASVESVRGETLPSGRALSGGEIAALMAACERDNTAAGARDAGIMACFYPGGLRRDEIALLDRADYDITTGALTVRSGKGNKSRMVYLSNGAGRAMADWISVRGDVPGALFWPVNKGGVMIAQRMSNQAVYNMLEKRGKEVGIMDLSPHDFRRTVIGDLLDAGVDIATVAKLAGHASVVTTARYDRRPEAAKVKAAGLLHLPYHGRK